MALTDFHIGQMRKTAVLKSNSATNATTGGRYDNYSTFLTTRCKLRKLSGSRSLEYFTIPQNEDYEMICRFQPTLFNNLGSNTVVEIDNMQMTVKSWEQVNQVKHIYRFLLSFTKFIENT